MKRILKHNFSLLNVDHVDLGPKWNYKNVISPYYRLYYIDAGEGEVSDSRKAFKLEPGHLYIIPSFTLCNLICRNSLSQYFIQYFEDSSDGISLFANHRAILTVKASPVDILNFKRLLEINPGRGINRSDNPKVYEKDMYYKEYQELNNLQNTGDFIETQGILLQLISRFLIPGLFEYQEPRHIPDKILDTINYIMMNMRDSLSVNYLADRANQHVDYFSRSFLHYTGQRPVTFIQSKRIERAQYLMVTSRLNFLQIAAETGFENVFYFSKIFKKVTGISPREYRKQIELVG